MEYETITISQKNDTCVVTLNRPAVHNAMNEHVIKELIDCFQKLSTNTSVRTIILTGNGPSFCAGADLTWMKGIVTYSKQQNKKDSQLILDLYETIFTCPKPVIGRINGNAFGGGIGLLAVCDITFAVPDAQFAFSEVKLGIIPAVISSFVSLRLQPADMQRLFLTGERFTSAYAHEIGLIDFVVPPEELDQKVDVYVKILRSSGPLAIQEIKNLIRTQHHMDLDAYKKFTVEKITELRMSPEGEEGITAFLEKRKPRWSE